MKITRRELAGALAAGAAAAQKSTVSGETPEDLRKAAADRLRRNAESLAKTQIAMAVEPAFAFRP
jgi:hypothetical protein